MGDLGGPAKSRVAELKVQDVIDRLTELGLDRDEATVYVHLRTMGPSKAADIATSLKEPRQKVYRLLQTLSDKGFVSSTLSRPTLFQAEAPETLFQHLFSNQEQRWEKLVKAQTEVLGALATMKPDAEGGMKSTFKLLHGRLEATRLMQQMVHDASSDFRAVCTHPENKAMGDMQDIVEMAVRRAMQGVNVRIAMTTNGDLRNRVGSFLDTPNLGVRHLDGERAIRYAIVDDSRLLMWVAFDRSVRHNAPEDVALWTDAPDFVGTQSLLFDGLWRSAKDLRELR